jgi:predicted O-methyltransferase YrrM
MDTKREKSTLIFHETGFHGDQYLLSLVDELMSQTDYFIETGTNVGSTLAFTAKKYPHITCLSCEPGTEAHSNAAINTSGLLNVRLYNETSTDFLIRIKREMQFLFHERVLFWLDAHGYGFDWPLKEEIEFITANFNKAIILIDDFKVPERGCFKYDSYKDQTCSYDFVKASFKSDFYRVYYPTYTDRTSSHHPLTGWGLITHNCSFDIPVHLKNKISLKVEVGIGPTVDREDAVKNASTCQGWTDYKKLAKLYDLVKSTEHLEGDILEIGSAWGRSTVLLGLASKKRIISIDPHTGGLLYIQKGEPQDSYNEFIDNISRFNLSDRVQVLKCTTTEAQEHSLLPVDTTLAFAFIDGLHSAASVTVDFNFTFNKLVESGVIVFDDYFEPSVEDYSRKIDALCKENSVTLTKDKETNLVYLFKGRTESIRSVREIEGYTPKSFSEAASARDLHKFNEDTESVYLISFPRTGSHWLRSVMELYFGRPTLTRTFYKHNNNNYLLLHHHDMDFNVIRDNVIYLYRDPVDTIYSQINYYKEDFTGDGRVLHWSKEYAKHLSKWLLDENFTKRKLIIRYEDLKSKPIDTFKLLSDFYGISLDEKRISEALSLVSKKTIREKTEWHNARVQNVDSGYDLSRREFRFKHAALIEQIIVSTEPRLRSLFDLPATTSTTVRTGVRSTPAKIVGLLAAKNEEILIEQCLRSLSAYTDAIVLYDDGSNDGTVKIAKNLQRECKVESIIGNDKWTYNEHNYRSKLLEEGRRIGGTHFIALDADEIFTSNLMDKDYLRSRILSLKPQEQISLVWIQLWRTLYDYRHDGSVWTDNYKPFIFCDDRTSGYADIKFHLGRTPNANWKSYRVPGYEYGVMHFQFVNWRNLLIKQAWYRCLERINNPLKPVADINKLYAPSKNEDGLGVLHAPAKWFLNYRQFDAKIYERPEVWREKDVLKWIDEYGKGYFAELDIWDIDWGGSEKNAQDRR